MKRQVQPDGTTRPFVTLIWAEDPNGVIGVDGAIPWRCPEDLKHFRRYTMGKTVVCGTSTFESLPILPGREVVQLSRTAPGAFRSPEECLRNLPDINELVVIGGAQTYSAFWDYADRLLVTEVTWISETWDAKQVTTTRDARTHPMARNGASSVPLSDDAIPWRCPEDLKCFKPHTHPMARYGSTSVQLSDDARLVTYERCTASSPAEGPTGGAGPD